MKLNWGTGIAIFYGAFMVFMIGFVILSRDVDHSLVFDDYYEKDINYQAHKDRVANSKALKTDLIIERVAGKEVRFQFPDLSGRISGEILFYKPDDQSKDFIVVVAPDASGLLTVRTSDLVSGFWRLKVNWQAGDRLFYTEKELIL